MEAYGNLTNRIQEGGAWRMPVVGEGATELMWSDRHAYTVTWVSKSGKTFRARQDKAIRTDSNGWSESQTYRFEPNPNGSEVTVRWTKRGWRNKGTGFKLGERDEYCDPSF